MSIMKELKRTFGVRWVFLLAEILFMEYHNGPLVRPEHRGRLPTHLLVAVLQTRSISCPTGHRIVWKDSAAFQIAKAKGKSTVDLTDGS